MRFFHAALAGLILHVSGNALAAAAPAYPFCVNASCGLIDRSGNWLVKPNYSKLVPSGPYWVAERASGLEGVLDAQGKVLIAPSFRDIGQFVDGLAPARGRESENYGYIDTSGKWVIEPRYFGARPFQKGIAQVILNPKDGPHLTTEFIDASGKRAIPREFLVSSSSSPSVNGLSLVEVAGADGEGLSALIDQRGRFIVPPRKDQFIDLEKDGSIFVRRGNSEYLVDANGKTLFQVSGEEAIIRHVGEGLAFFEKPGQGVGLIDVRTGKIVVTPHRNWVWVGEFNDGLANLRILLPNNDVSEGYIDRSGKMVIEARFRNASPFVGGLAVVSGADGHEGVIDRTGQWWRKPLEGQSFRHMSDDEIQDAGHLRSVMIAYRSSGGNPGGAYTPDDAEILPVARLPVLQELFDGQQLLASVRQHPCGIEVGVNAKGERIWPENLLGRCAAEQLSNLGYDEEKLSPAARAAYLEEKRRSARVDAEWKHEVEQRDKHSGDIYTLMTRRMYPEKAARDDRLRKLVEDAGWIRGEQEVSLHGPARITLPAGLKLLVPEKVAALREKMKAEMAIPLPLPPGYLALQEQKQAGTITEEEYAKREKQWREMFPAAFAAKAKEEKPAGKEDVVIPMAMIADENDRWQASLHVVASGYLDLDENSLPAPDDLIETLRTYGFWRNTGGIGTEVIGHSSYEWISPLHLDQPEKILSWAYRYSDMYSGKAAGQGFRHGVVGNVVVPGRSYLVQVSAYWDGPFSDSLGESYFPEVLAMAQQIHFEPGQTYGDYVEGEKRVQIPLKYLVTGAPPESLQRFSASVQHAIQRDEEEKQERMMHQLQRLGPVVFSMLALFFGARRRSKGKRSEAAE